MRTRLACAVLGGLLLLSAPTPASAAAPDGAAPPAGEARSGAGAAPEADSLEPCATRAAARVQARYEGVRDLRARFSQVTRRAGGAGTAPTTARGTFVLAKPGRMRWTYEEPEPSLVVSDGVTLWVYDPAFGEVQRMPVDQGALSGAAVQFLLGEGDLFRDFRVAALSCGEASVDLLLTPREPATYETLQIAVDPRSGDLLRSRLVDLLGTVIELEISALEVDVAPPDSLFHFEPPPGVRVTDLGP